MNLKIVRVGDAFEIHTEDSRTPGFLVCSKSIKPHLMADQKEWRAAPLILTQEDAVIRKAQWLEFTKKNLK